jgi:hypothetical protein
MALVPGNPYVTSTRSGTFRRYTDGVFQGLADADPAVQNYLNMGSLPVGLTAPMWGGLPIFEEVFQGTLGANKALINPATSTAQITGWTVFDQGHHGVITPGPNNVPLFYPGMDIPFYRSLSGARIPVQASSSLASLVGGSINPTVTWNFVTGELEATAAGPSFAVSSIVVSGTANPFSGLATTTTPHGFSVGDSVTQAGFTPAGYNGAFEILSVPSPTTYTINLTANPGAITVEGTVATTAGTGTLAVRVLSLHTNSRIVYQNPVTGGITWQDGVCAIIQL